MEKIKKALKLFLLFFKIGLTTFGGGYAMISVFEEEFVSKLGYITQDEMLELVAIAESTPGPIAINAATYIGYKRAGFLGCLFSTIGIVLPSFIIILLISAFYDKFMQIELVQKAFKGIECGVGVLITLAGIKMLKRLDKTAYNIIWCVVVTVFMVVVSVLAIEFSALYIVAIGGGLGLILTAINAIKNYKNSREKSTKIDENATMLAQNELEITNDENNATIENTIEKGDNV